MQSAMTNTSSIIRVDISLHHHSVHESKSTVLLAESSTLYELIMADFSLIFNFVCHSLAPYVIDFIS